MIWSLIWLYKARKKERKQNKKKLIHESIINKYIRLIQWKKTKKNHNYSVSGLIFFFWFKVNQYISSNKYRIFSFCFLFLYTKPMWTNFHWQKKWCKRDAHNGAIETNKQTKSENSFYWIFFPILFVYIALKIKLRNKTTTFFHINCYDCFQQ